MVKRTSIKHPTQCWTAMSKSKSESHELKKFFDDNCFFVPRTFFFGNVGAVCKFPDKLLTSVGF